MRSNRNISNKNIIFSRMEIIKSEMKGKQSLEPEKAPSNSKNSLL